MSPRSKKRERSQPRAPILTAAILAVFAVAVAIGLGLAGRESPVDNLAPFTPQVAERPRPERWVTTPRARATAAAKPAATAALGMSREEENDDGEEPDGPTVVSLARSAAEDYRRRARFPRWSHPLEEGEDPILRDRQISPIKSRGANGSEPVLVIFPGRVSYEAPEPAEVYAYLTVAGERIPAESITGVILTEAMAPIGEVEFRDDGGNGDVQADDRIYTATFTPDEDNIPFLSESMMVRVRAVTRDGEERRGATSFQYSNPHAHLTGRYRDRVEDGHLVIEAEVEVVIAGRFHIEGTLYDAEGNRSIVWSQSARELDPGIHWMELRFWGLALNEAGIDGPYRLRFVALSTTTQMPNAKNRLAEDAHLTAPYTAADFAAEPFNDPELLDAAERLESELGDTPNLDTGLR